MVSVDTEYHVTSNFVTEFGIALLDTATIIDVPVEQWPTKIEVGLLIIFISMLC